MQEPKFLRLADVPEYVHRLTGLKPSRQTIYNWASKGRKVRGTDELVRLKVRLRVGQLFTTEEWVMKFLNKVGE